MSKRWIVLVIQVLLAACFIWASMMKLFQAADKLAAMWPWTKDHALLVKGTGIVDLLLGIGLILPVFVRVRAGLVVFVGYCIIALMVAASIFHLSRGEASNIGFNIVVAMLAGVVVWGEGKIGQH